MIKKLIASDFDGTLYRLGKITKYDIRNIKKWQADGRYFGIVTGRGSDFTKTISEFDVKPDFLILYNGALIIDKNGNILKESFIDSKTYNEISDFLSGFSDVISFGKKTDTEFNRQFYARFNTPERSLEVADVINDRFGDKITAFVNGTHINIAKKGTSKSNGVSFTLSHFGLNEDECAVVGDDFNDLDMIITHDGWAMLTGRREVRKKANHICTSVGSLASTLIELR